jgi:molybdopterin-containing oxidoreductase family membrane subunit
MTNRVPWGLPHVFAYFLILAASGALNVAMVASVFRRAAYQPLAPFSALLAMALLAGGLSVLVLDLGRPDRLLLTVAHPNPRSIFAWNIVLYNGFLAVTAAYLVTLLNRRFGRLGLAAGLTMIAFLWRFVLTTGTGTDLGVLVAREPIHSAVMAPLFIAFSLAFGLAVFLLLLPVVAWLGDAPADEALLQRLGRLLALFVGVSFYLAVVLHVINLYAPQTRALERYLLLDGGPFRPSWRPPALASPRPAHRGTPGVRCARVERRRAGYGSSHREPRVAARLRRGPLSEPGSRT